MFTCLIISDALVYMINMPSHVPATVASGSGATFCSANHAGIIGIGSGLLNHATVLAIGLLRLPNLVRDPKAQTRAARISAVSDNGTAIFWGLVDVGRVSNFPRLSKHFDYK